MRVVIYSSDKTSWSLRPFAYLFNRYWRDDVPVLVFGNTAPHFELPANFTFTSIGPFQPATEWTTDLITALLSITDDVFCLMMDDYWINRPVDHRAICLCYEYMLTHPDIGRFCICTDRTYARDVTDYGTLDDLDVIKSDPLSPYHFSYQASLWRRTTLLDCLVPHETPWNSEIAGDARLRDLGALVLGTRQGPLRYTIAVQKGVFKPGGGYQTPHNAMNVEDVQYILDQGWVPAALLEKSMTAYL